ncbi:MAG: MinD/ParA family protein [Nitrospirae bacterium]|nr:MinD/ParA family protein [Nitrospirota bacterium]
MAPLTQAQQLTRWVTRKGGRIRVLAVTSGKGGVGKTNVTVNLADRLARMGYRILVLDGDMGLGNVDVMVGLSTTRTLADVFAGHCTLEEIIHEGPGGIQIIPGGSGIVSLTQLGEEGQLTLLSQIGALTQPPDYLILDTAAGIGDNVRFLAGCAQEILVVATPDPTSITDAYALMKVMSAHHGERRFRLLVNLAKNADEGLEVYRRLSLAADRFLGVAVDYAGFVPVDHAISRAVRSQTGISNAPASAAADAFTRLARTVDSWRPVTELKGGMQFFFNQVADAQTAALSAGG